jgi:hypothetical protein
MEGCAAAAKTAPVWVAANASARARARTPSSAGVHPFIPLFTQIPSHPSTYPRRGRPSCGSPPGTSPSRASRAPPRRRVRQTASPSGTWATRAPKRAVSTFRRSTRHRRLGRSTQPPRAALRSTPVEQVARTALQWLRLLQRRQRTRRWWPLAAMKAPTPSLPTPLPQPIQLPPRQLRTAPPPRPLAPRLTTAPLAWRARAAAASAS